MQLRRSWQQGFTIVELMIATAVFSVVLLIVTAGVIAFSRQYYKGIINNRTQNVARTALNEVTQSIQFSAGTVTDIQSVGRTDGICINDQPYYYVIGGELNGPSGDSSTTRHALLSAPGPCPDTVPTDISTGNISGPDVRELLGDKMRLTDFKVVSHDDATVTVAVNIARGDRDLLCSSNVSGSCASRSIQLNDSQLSSGDEGITCRAGTGSEYCAYIGLTAQVTRRVQ